MLEHFEVVELEKKWEEYNKKRKKFGYGLNLSKFKFDKTVMLLLVLISVASGAIAWLLLSSNEEITLAQIDKNINANNVNSTPSASTILDKEIDVNLTNMAQQSYEKNETFDRGSLKFNDIGIDASVDAGGFVLNDSYKSKPNDSEIIEKKPFSTIPKDEIIDFKSPPVPPKSIISSSSASKRIVDDDSKGKIVIKTTNLKEDANTLEEKFYASNDIMYSLMLSENAYNKKRYDEAIKWALISNEINKDNAKSWILFAKANYKKGNKKDALLALETFNKRLPNKEVDGVIRQIKDGAL
ncbi:hypothetical protein [Campylobacter geochelonis]|uniref:Transformation system protein n=1 Tax=Campylobacter geochelonis TaxID=1780362 RepID=A0A128EJR2_9BACT|nr:hypothetical protein [Campylobacter geochelonis]QKF71247.1 hypothetical protein CGEO_0931 [Campylobacter geochelonis]CZE49185.1 Transformation system protein [Campylobacter geochelonis]